MSYPEYLVNIKKGIVTEDGHCPVTPLLIMLQGRWKSQLMYEMCIYDTVRFGQLKKDLPGITNYGPVWAAEERPSGYYQYDAHQGTPGT